MARCACRSSAMAIASAPMPRSASLLHLAMVPTSWGCSRARIWRCMRPRRRAVVCTASSSPAWRRKPMPAAMAEGGFEVHYQPLADLDSEKIVGCEALLRWRPPLRGMISPAEFVPLAEETGLIQEIGQWVLDTACREAAKWPLHV